MIFLRAQYASPTINTIFLFMAANLHLNVHMFEFFDIKSMKKGMTCAVRRMTSALAFLLDKMDKLLHEPDHFVEFKAVEHLRAFLLNLEQS